MVTIPRNTSWKYLQSDSEIEKTFLCKDKTYTRRTDTGSNSPATSAKDMLICWFSKREGLARSNWRLSHYQFMVHNSNRLKDTLGYTRKKIYIPYKRNVIEKYVKYMILYYFVWYTKLGILYWSDNVPWEPQIRQEVQRWTEEGSNFTEGFSFGTVTF